MAGLVWRIFSRLVRATAPLSPRPTEFHSSGSGALPAMRCDHLDTMALGPVTVQTVTVIGSVADQSFRRQYGCLPVRFRSSKSGGGHVQTRWFDSCRLPSKSYDLRSIGKSLALEGSNLTAGVIVSAWHWPAHRRHCCMSRRTNPR